MDNATFLINTAKFLATQKRRCSMPDDGDATHAQCLYTDGEGNRCAIGTHFTEELACRLQDVGISAPMIINVAENTVSGRQLTQQRADPINLVEVCKQAEKVLRGVSVHLLSEAQILHDKQPFRGQSHRRMMLSTLAGMAEGVQEHAAAQTIREINVPETV